MIIYIRIGFKVTVVDGFQKQLSTSDDLSFAGCTNTNTKIEYSRLQQSIVHSITLSRHTTVSLKMKKSSHFCAFAFSIHT